MLADIGHHQQAMSLRAGIGADLLDELDVRQLTAEKLPVLS